jgi:xyloglucan-specific exo-beta-1,4-glucanase
VPLKLVRTHSGPARGALSLDGGTTWRDFPAPPPPATAHGPGSIALSADGRRLVWLPKGSAPFVSTDDGATWTPSRGGPVARDDYRIDRAVADRVSADKFYIYDSVAGRVFVSTNGGKIFSAVATLPAEGGTLRAAPGRDGSIWVPTPEGLFVSNDTGAHFEKLTGVDAAVQIGFGARGPGDGPPMLFMLGRVGGVPALFRSDDSGRSWIAISDGPHKFGWLKVITGDARVPGRVYLGTGGRGIVVGEPAGK